ncbi:hypothetical protein CAP39_09550 [Sphingomonas sp. IBVSS1]|uniref:Uncharacterized protein n=2 Tax=Sandarakinorhabdus cyanobacteriorum TaxID=1981098 RepID=A0A255YUX5_9SPHN|nr:hypothetical protein CAP39_09550 [Sphingomonas sp. IBVSS1]OYQ33046.1 hypothetical protein CHU93_03355 [Sandarakinorhabdus cyanobacteriorum]
MLELLRSGAHEFALAGAPDLRVVANRSNDGAWDLAIVGRNGQRVPPTTLPHWEVERPRAAPQRKRSWWQSLLDPDAN